MASTPYFQSVVTESAFHARFRSENGKTFSKLEEVSASLWGRRHLLACRVVRRELQRNVLPVLLHHIKPSDIQSPSDEINAFLRGPDSTLMAQSEHYLVRSSNCSLSVAQIWAAMATFKGPLDRRGRGTNVLDEPNEHMQDSETDLETREPKRLRRPTSQPDFVDPTRTQFGSSSPVHSDSYHGSQSSSVGYVDQDTHSLARVPEDDTLRLVSCVLRHILYYAAPQDSVSQPTVVEFRDAKTRLAPSTTRDRQIIAIDDGGLCLRQQKQDGSFLLTDNHVAILEAKPQFQCLQDGRPIISDESFAQMVCEALATRLSYPTTALRQSVIVINATQHYICFLQVDFSDEYIDDLESPSPEHMLYISSTPWFDLDRRSGRESVLANLCGIMRRVRVASKP